MIETKNKSNFWSRIAQINRPTKKPRIRNHSKKNPCFSVVGEINKSSTSTPKVIIPVRIHEKGYDVNAEIFYKELEENRKQLAEIKKIDISKVRRRKNGK